MEDKLEEIRLLARFKLQARRLLNQSVDLEKLRNDPVYAADCLARVEEKVDDEELLVLALRLRGMLVPHSPAAQPVPVVAEPPATTEKKYLFGARS